MDAYYTVDNDGSRAIVIRNSPDSVAPWSIFYLDMEYDDELHRDDQVKDYRPYGAMGDSDVALLNLTPLADVR